MKVVVTGGAGFIGSNFVHFLRKARADWKITVVDLLTYAGNLKNIAALLDKGEVVFKKIDIADQNLPQRVT
jgi:dTDP-glucose 4,6-dehydratase